MRSKFPTRIKNLSKQVAKIHHSFHFNTSCIKKELISDNNYQQIAVVCGKEKEVADAFLLILATLKEFEEIHNETE